MKIVLLSINASWTHSCLALQYLRNAIQDLKHETQLIELTLKQSVSEALEAIYADSPDVLCISVYIWNVMFVKQLLPEIRKILPRIKIVLGGPEVSYNESAFAQLQPDYLIKGYGETAFRALAEQNFVSMDSIIMGKHLPLVHIPFPYSEEDKAQLKGKMLYYEASRGCACKCIYCLSSREDKMDWLSYERVCADIDKLLLLEPKVIKFVDRSFNQKKEWARSIWQYVISLETKIPFHFEIHPDWLEPKDIELLSKTPKGRIQFEIGIQSIHAETLKAISRVSDWHKVKQNLMLLKQKTVIPLHVDIIAGLPGEDLSSIKQSVNEVLVTYPDELQLGFLKILAGTHMAEIAQEHNYQWCDSPPYQVLSNQWLTFTDLLYLEKIAAVTGMYWNKGDFSTVWAKAITIREPFKCLDELLEVSLLHDGQLHSLDMIKRFEVMALWLGRYWSGEEQQYLQDALKWDWCKKTGEPWFPAALQADYCLTFRKEHYTELYEWLKTEYWEQTDWNFKRFVTFSAVSNEFADKHLEGYSKAVFVNQKSGENACVIIKHIF